MDPTTIYTFRQSERVQTLDEDKSINFNCKETKNSTLENDTHFNNMSESSQGGKANDSQQEESLDMQKQANYNMVGMNKKEALLNFKINELQKICMTLTQANKKLLDRVDELQNLREVSQQSEQARDSMRESYASSIRQQTELFNGFAEIEHLVRDYRKSLQQCRVKIQLRIFEHQRVNEILKQEISRLTARDQVIQKKLSELQKSNLILEARNEFLQSQFKTKDKKVTSSKKLPTIAKTCEMSNNQLSKHLDESDFSLTVHAQLQQLIEKLINELEHQRKIKEKMKEEIKRIGKELIDVEKQIMAKNSKIYLLELNAIKRERMSLVNTHKQHEESMDADSLVTYKRQMTESPEKTLKSFTLIDLLNNEVTVTFNEKLYIAWKILQFFDRKIGKKDYRLAMVQEFTINNFSSKNYNLISIDCQFRKSQERNGQQQNRESTILNMAFILDTLINQVPDEEQSEETYKNLTQYKDQLSKMLEYILSKRKESMGHPVQNLKEQIRQIILAIDNL